MIFASLLFLLILATIVAASASGSDNAGSNLKLVALKHSFKIEDGSTEEEKKYKILLDDTKTKHFFFHLSKEGLLKIEIPKDSAGTLFFYSCNLAKSASAQPVFLEAIDLQDNNFNFPKGTMIIVLYSASDSSFKGLPPMQLTFPFSKYMGECGRGAIAAFNAQFRNQNVSRGFFLLNPSNELLESPLWALVVIVVILVLDVFFIAGFMFWCYWIKRAEKIKSDK